MRTSVLIKWFSTIVLFVISAMLVFGIAVPNLVSSASTEAVIAGFALAIGYILTVLILVNKYINSKKEAR